MRNLLATLIAVVVLGGCDNDLGSQIVPDGSTDGGNLFSCESLRKPPQGCGTDCVIDSNCNLGLFCNNGECVAACTADDPCPEGEQCGARGRCVDIPEDGGNDAGDGQSCIDDEITPTRIVPNIMFLIDKSGSMDVGINGGGNPPAGQTRWELARSAILTVVGELDTIVWFGATSYNNTLPNNDPGCPELGINVDFGLNNESTIATNYPSDPAVVAQDTPTGDAITALVGNIRSDPPPAHGPTILVLATDGEPDRCENGDGHDEISRDEVIAAAADAYTPPVNNPPHESITTFVLSVGADISTSHLQDVACEGVGIDHDDSSCNATNAPFWVADEAAELEEHFRQIVTDQISCEVQMNGTVEDFDRVCEGEVELDGTPLTCQHGNSCTPGPDSNCNGWRIKDGTDDTLELLGQACQDFKEGAEPLTAVFPCGIIIVE